MKIKLIKIKLIIKIKIKIIKIKIKIIKIKIKQPNFFRSV